MDSRILIIDDDAASCAFMKDVLIQATGSEVLALTESRAASTCIAKEKFMGESTGLPDAVARRS